MESNSGLFSSLLLTQYIIWLLALLQFILALYELVINAWRGATLRRASYYLAMFLLILAINTFAEGGLVGASNRAQATSASILVAISAPALPAALFLSYASLLRFNLLFPGHETRKPLSAGSPIGSSVRIRKNAQPGIILRWSILSLMLLPLLLTLVDLSLASYSSSSTRLWYSGIDPSLSYSGGYFSREIYTKGLLEPLVTGINFIGINLLTLGFLLYEAILAVFQGNQPFSKQLRRILTREELPPLPDPIHRSLVWFLLISIPLVALFLGFALFSFRSASLGGAITGTLPVSTGLILNILFTVVSAVAIFRRMVEISAIREQRPVPVPVEGESLPELTRGASDLTTFEQQLSRVGWGTSLQTRLVSATIVVALPLLAAMGILLTRQAQRQLELNAAQTLSQMNLSLGNQVTNWLDANLSAMQNVAASPSIRSMSPSEQQPMLESTALTYPDYYLISTLDLEGVSLARSDRQLTQDFSGQGWFQEASLRGEIIYRPIVGRDIWKPDLVIVTPIRSEPAGPILGYLMALITLDKVSTHFQETRLGEQGFAILVDDRNNLLAHPDWAQSFPRTLYGLQDMTSHPPVAALPAGDNPDFNPNDEGSIEIFNFNDSEDLSWQAAIRRLDNGWGLIVQQREDELLAPIATFQRISLIVLLTGAAMLIPLMLLTVRNSLQPVEKLTQTARAIATGDLSHLASLEIASEPGEIGLLASTFNTMAIQLRQLIGGLEQRVTERTQLLQRRALQLQVAAEVASEAASIRDPEELLRNVVNLISERFDFYHAGLFLLQRSSYSEIGSAEKFYIDSETGSSDVFRSEGYAVLQAASSEGGQHMLARHHRLKVGPAGSGVGIVGYVAYTGLPRVALDVGADAVFFNNPDLPLTRSELALPLLVAATDQRSTTQMQKRSARKGAARRVIGVLDVQSTQEAAFGQDDIEILQILADQIAVALENARLLSESQKSLQQLQQIYGERVRQSWQERIKRARTESSTQEPASTTTPEIIYSFDSSRIQNVTVSESNIKLESNQLKVTQQHHNLQQSDLNSYRSCEPIVLRGQELGHLVLQRDKPWTPEEKELIRDTMTQVALALENARLMEEIQQRAFQEELVSQMISNTQRSLDLETVMRSMIREIALAIPVERINLHLLDGSTPDEVDDSENGSINSPVEGPNNNRLPVDKKPSIKSGGGNVSRS